MNKEDLLLYFLNEFLNTNIGKVTTGKLIFE